MNRVERGIKAGRTREQVFPKLGQVGAEVSGEGVTVKVKFVKAPDAMPVRFVGAEAMDAAAVREVDMLNKYHWTSSKLSEKLGLSTNRAAALREHLGIDGDADCTYTVPHNSQKLTYYSDNAYARMRDAIKNQDTAAIWESHSKVKRTKPRPACSQPVCAQGASSAKAS